MPKNLVKTKVRKAAFEKLLLQKQSHSKMDNINYNKLEIQGYMNNPVFDDESVKMLLALRTRTVRGVKNDFRGMFPDVACPVGCGNTDTLQHILTCSVLQNNLQSEALSSQMIKFEDIYSTDIVKQKEITQLYIQLMDIREKIISSPPVFITGPVH